MVLTHPPRSPRMIAFGFLLLLLLLVPVAGAAPALDWASALGGTGRDSAYCVQQQAGGGYIIAGETGSSDGDVPQGHGAGDAWIVNLSVAGDLIWQHPLGGSEHDEARAIRQTADGGYIVAGYTYSSDGDVSGWHPGTIYGVPRTDAWVVRLDASGAIAWQKCLGGSGYDRAWDVLQTADGGFVVAGSTSTENDGDVEGHHHGGDEYYSWENDDAWVVRLDAAGTLLWQHCLGGTEDDVARAVVPAFGGGYVVAGYTASRDGDVTSHHGGSDDVWVAEVDDTGVLVWQRTYGGSRSEQAFDLQRTADDGFIVAGYTDSSDGDVTGGHGVYRDAWVVRLNATGGIVWQHPLGGSEVDETFAVRQTRDGGFIAAGYTYSQDGDLSGTGYRRYHDVWAVRLDAAGGLAWQKILTGADWNRWDSAEDVLQAGDGGFVIAGWVRSDGWDVTGFHGPVGTEDAWVARLAPEAFPPVTVPGGAAPSKDPDGDGLHEDVNGNNRPDFADVVLYFNQMGWLSTIPEIPLFDYNGNGRIDFADIVWLFNHL